MGAYVTPLYGGSGAQVDYRLGVVQHGCDSDAQLGYRVDARERALRWIGQGLEAFGVDGLSAGAELTESQFEAARRLIQGQHPATGAQLVTPKMAVPAEAKLSLSPLVAAVNEAAQARGVAPESLFGTESLRAGWEKAARGVSRRGGRAVARVDEATELAGAAGLSAGEVWGVERVAAARAALYEPSQVHDRAGQPVMEPDGTPRIEMVERRERVGIAGYDIGINLPKSLSVLLAFAPEETAARLEGVYAAATETTLGWTEGRTSYVKRGKHGDGHVARQERSSGFSGWVMTHRAARPVGELPIGDPHWHVHITIANLAQAPDGTWLTIAAGGRELMRHAPAIDKVTQAQIRAELHREFGITFTRGSSGAWEVEHIPDAALTVFSKRHQQVTEVLTALGYSNKTASAKEARVLTRASRSGKTETVAEADVTLREYWRAQAMAAGYDPDEWMPAVFAAYHAGHETGTAQANETVAARHGITVDDLVAQLIDPQVGLTAHTRRFSHLQALAATADALPHGAQTEEVEQLTELALAHPAFVALAENTLVAAGEGRTQLAGSHQMTGGRLYTTRDVPQIERELLERIGAVAAAGPGRVVASPERLAAAIEACEIEQGYPLSTEQRQVLDRLVTGGRRYESLEGPPGTGKTTLMRTARVAWEAEGFTVAGAATAARAAQELAQEAGIESRTVAQWIWQIHHGDGLTGVDKLVVDEANLTDDRDRILLVREATRTGTEILEIHDPAQLRAPGVGSLAGYLHGVLDGPRLTENRRQRSEDERAALADFRAGRHHDALQRWNELGQVVATTSTDQGVAAMVAQWMRLADGAPDPYTRAGGLLMLASTNEQVDRINTAVQAVRDAENQLGPGAVFALPGGREVSFHLGDAVLLRRNDRTQQAVTGEAVLNGYQGVVTSVDAGGVSVAWRQPGDSPGQPAHTATCTPDYIAAGGLELGYCLTAHKAEGMTIGAQWDRPDGSRNHGSVLVWAPGMDAPGLYVAASRDRGQTLLYGALDELESDREQLLYGTPRDQTELVERVIAATTTHTEATITNPDDQPVLLDLEDSPTSEHTPEHDHTEKSVSEILAQLEHARAERENRQRWQQRPHSTLTADQLRQEISQARREHTDLLAAAERAHTQHTERQAAVTSGNGPRVAALNTRMTELARIAELDTTAEQLRTRLNAAKEHERGLVAQAYQKRQQAELTSRLRPGRREQLFTEAAQLHQQHSVVRAETDQLNRQLRELTAAGASPEHRPGAGRAAFEHAQLAYQHDRDTAQGLDNTELATIAGLVDTYNAAAGKATTKGGDLQAELDLRAGMTPEQADLEHGYRTDWHLEQATAALARRAEERLEAQWPRDLNYERTYEHDHGYDLDDGYDLGY